MALNYLITGGAGFIGSNYVHRLVQRGAHVTIYDNLSRAGAPRNLDWLKKDFGDKVVFHGAIDEQEVLPFGSVSDVKKEVKHKIEVLGKSGGYILAACHEIQNDTPVENIIAMYDAAMEYGGYE